MSYYIFFIVHFLSTYTSNYQLAPQRLNIRGIGIRKCFPHTVNNNSNGSKSSKKDLDVQGKSTNLKIVCRVKHTSNLVLLGKYAVLQLIHFSKNYQRQREFPVVRCCSIQTGSTTRAINEQTCSYQSTKTLMNFITGRVLSKGEVDIEKGFAKLVLKVE